MTKAELEAKPLSELHALAAEAGVERYRMLSRAELVEKLGGGSGQGSRRAPRSGSAQRSGSERSGSEQRDRPPRRRRSRGGRKPTSGDSGGDREARGAREPRKPREPRREPKPKAEPALEPEATPTADPAAAPAPAEPARRPRRRRRRFGRRGKQGVDLQDLLLPPVAGRQAILCAATREGCTALLRGVAADLAGDSKGPDPVVLLIDPSPEELADWRREAPQAEIVAAGQPRHASDALAQAGARAGSGDDVILLVDSLTRLAEAYGDAEAAKEFFDAGRTQSGPGTLTILAALERPAGA
jgi:transcription termination factor Rho